ncbi:MAG TPA: diacylglycerol kinase family protein [Vicinamibacterales bacterium]|jgi:diacylglycerol kinase family enzyme
MRISLLFNESAGDGVSSEWLCETMEKNGHGPVHLFEKSDFHDVLANSPELVVAAGGDGTVRRAVEAIAGQGIPMAILPLGTANNVARSVGIEGPITQLIERWHDANRRPLDLGIVRGSWGQNHFLEGVGSGLIPAGISAMKEELEDDEQHADARVARAVRGFHEVFARLEPRRWTLTLDGTRMEDEFLVLEVLNIRSVGPNLVLFPDADPSDGYLSVVIAKEQHRKELDGYLRCLIEGGDCRVSLPRQLVRHVEIGGCEEIHVDDRLLRSPQLGVVSIDIQPAAVDLLI